MRALAESLPIVKIDVSLAENASQGADRDLVLPGHNSGIDYPARASHELDMAALLGGFEETGRLQSTLDFAEGLGAKPRQPRPRSSGLQAAASLAEVRSEVPALPSGC